MSLGFLLLASIQSLLYEKDSCIIISKELFIILSETYHCALLALQLLLNNATSFMGYPMFTTIYIYVHVGKGNFDFK